MNKEKPYNLEERTFEFSKSVALFCNTLPKTIPNQEYIRQVVRSSGSVGANYIEANEALSKKDFKMRLKISRKEAKESSYWLKLLKETNEQKKIEGEALQTEATELMKILSSIIEKTK